MASILIVEDEPKLAQLLNDYLSREGHQTQIIGHGDEVMAWFREHGADLVLLDIMLPGTDGLSLCREIRAISPVPIVMTTAKVEEIDRILGLELGADDYICKPYSPREVVARVKAHLRRINLDQAPEPAGQGSQLLELEPTAQRVRANGQEEELTSVEFALLETLSAAPGRIFSRDALMDRIYPDRRVVSDRTIDSHVKKLRRKLEGLLPGKDVIHSVYGAGYRFEEPPQ